MYVYRCHPALRAGRSGPMVGSTPLHLHQSDLDGACGHHCAAMAAQLLGIAGRAELMSLPKPKSKALGSFWRASVRNYFVGTTSRELKAVLLAFGSGLEIEVCRKQLIDRSLIALGDRGLAIVNIEGVARDFNHWVLAVGIAGREVAGDVRPATLLILDPSHAPVSLVAWNATLSIKADGRDLHHYVVPHSAERVAVSSVVTLRRR